MDFKEINELTSKENKEKAEHAKAEQRAAAAGVCQAYARLFQTEDGQKVLQHLTDKCLINNDTPLTSQNINYEAAYKNGEAGVVKFIMTQVGRARDM